jgi:transposase
MPFAALDLHKKQLQAVVLDDLGQPLHRSRFPATAEALHAFARQHLPPGTVIALEATFNTWPIAALLQPYVQEVVVSNPLQTRAIAQAKVKTDKIDAEVLAHLLRCNYLPRVWIPDPETRDLRHLTTERANLSSDRTRVKNRIHAVLHQRLLAPPCADLFSPAGRAWLQQLPLDPSGRRTLDRHLRQLDLLDQQLDALTTILAQHAHRSPQVRLLLTIPGVDVAVAEALFATLGDIQRFPSPDQAAAYLGLVPSTYQSGEKTYHGRITKQGRAHARWLLVQAAQHLAVHPGPLGHFFRRLAQRKNRNVAVVATARKLVTIAWRMLQNNEPYRYAQPRTTEAKLSRLRIRATGQKRKGGNPKGAGRPAAYGSGQPTRGIPSLDQLYSDNELPPRQPAPPGEARLLDRAGLTPFVQSLAQPRRVPKKPAAPRTRASS